MKFKFFHAFLFFEKRKRQNTMDMKKHVKKLIKLHFSLTKQASK